MSASIVGPDSQKATRPPPRPRPSGPADDESQRMSPRRIALASRLNSTIAAPAKAPLSPRPPPSRNGRHISEFADLYHQYFPKVFAYVYGRVQNKELSLDIVSDVFEKAFIKQQSLRSPDAFGSWLFTIARNEVSSHWRREKPAAKAVQEVAREKE